MPSSAPLRQLLALALCTALPFAALAEPVRFDGYEAFYRSLGGNLFEGAGSALSLACTEAQQCLWVNAMAAAVSYTHLDVYKRQTLGLPRHTALTEHHSGGWPSPCNLRSSTTLAPLMRVCDETPSVSQSTVNRSQLAKRSAPLDGSAPGSTAMLACAGRRTTRVRHLVSPCAGQIALTGPEISSGRCVNRPPGTRQASVP